METYEQMQEKKKQIKEKIEKLREENKTADSLMFEYKEKKKDNNEKILNNKILLLQLSVDILEAKQTKKNGGVAVNPQ